MQDLILSPSDVVAVINQTLEFAYSTIIVEGEISSFRISKNRWVYFDIKDDGATVRCFGTIYMLPGPIEDGMRVRLQAQPRLHPNFGFSLNFSAIEVAGEGSIKKAFLMLKQKLEGEGLFDPARKRPLPEIPKRVGLITSFGSAAYHDFIKILGERWGGIEIVLIDTLVQGMDAPSQIVQAIEQMNTYHEPLDVLVITRGGGSADDLGAFSNELVTRAVGLSRIPTLVAIGHEIDVSLAELAADMRASTPTNAASILVPDRKHALQKLNVEKNDLASAVNSLIKNSRLTIDESLLDLKESVRDAIKDRRDNAALQRQLLMSLSPNEILKRGYSIVRRGKILVHSVKDVHNGDRVALQFVDGYIDATIG